MRQARAMTRAPAAAQHVQVLPFAAAARLPGFAAQAEIGGKLSFETLFDVYSVLIGARFQ